MKQPLATVHINTGHHEPAPTIKIYHGTCISTAVAHFIHQYQLPAHVFEFIIKQIQEELVAHRLLASPFPRNQPQQKSKDSQTHCRISSAHDIYERRTEGLGGVKEDSPFYRLFEKGSEKQGFPLRTFELRQEERMKYPSSVKQIKSFSNSRNCKSVGKKKGEKSQVSTQKVFKKQEGKIRQFFKFLTRKSSQGLLTKESVTKLTTKSPRLAKALSKILKDSKKNAINEENFISQANKLNLSTYFERDLSRPKLMNQKERLEAYFL